MRPMMTLICLTALLAAACSGTATRPDQDDDEPISANAGLLLSLEDLHVLKESAMKGSTEAARKLGSYYLIARADDTEAWRWYAIGAENGDAMCMYSLWSISDRNSDRLIRIRGDYWLKRAAALGDESAVQTIQLREAKIK